MIDLEELKKYVLADGGQSLRWEAALNLIDRLQAAESKEIEINQEAQGYLDNLFAAENRIENLEDDIDRLQSKLADLEKQQGGVAGDLWCDKHAEDDLVESFDVALLQSAVINLYEDIRCLKEDFTKSMPAQQCNDKIQRFFHDLAGKQKPMDFDISSDDLWDMYIQSDATQQSPAVAVPDLILSEKAQLKYENILKHQDWIKTDLDKLAIKLSCKINVEDNVGLMDYYPATIFAKHLVGDSFNEIERLRKGISDIIETVIPPCVGVSPYQALAISPIKLIEHCNNLLSAPTPPSADHTDKFIDLPLADINESVAIKAKAFGHRFKDAMPEAFERRCTDIKLDGEITEESSDE